MAVYPEAVHYQDAEGKWREIDNRLTEKESPWTACPTEWLE